MVWVILTCRAIFLVRPCKPVGSFSPGSTTIFLVVPFEPFGSFSPVGHFSGQTNLNRLKHFNQLELEVGPFHQLDHFYLLTPAIMNWSI